MNTTLKPFDYDRVADFYDNIELDSKLNEAIIHGLVRTLKELSCKTVWDASCGTGAQAIPLHKENFKVYATDLSAQMIEKAKIKAPEISFQQADMRQHNLPEKVDAIIVMMNSLSHLSSSELLQALKNFYSNLKPSGYLIADFDNKIFLQQHIQDDYFVSRVCFIDRIKYLRLTKAVSLGEGTYEIHDIWQKQQEIFFQHICETQCWTQEEMTNHLTDSAFRVIRWYDRRFLEKQNLEGPDTDSLLFIAQKG